MQKSLYHFGFVRFDGHNGMVRRKVLEAIGGWPEEVSEDLAASIQSDSKAMMGFSSAKSRPRKMPQKISPNS